MPACAIEITSSAVELEIHTITAGIQKYQWTNKKKNKKHDKIVLIEKTWLNTIAVLISKTSIEPYISHDELALVSNVLREYDDMKKEKKNLKTSAVHWIF